MSELKEQIKPLENAIGQLEAQSSGMLLAAMQARRL